MCALKASNKICSLSLSKPTHQIEFPEVIVVSEHGQRLLLVALHHAAAGRLARRLLVRVQHDRVRQTAHLSNNGVNDKIRFYRPP